MASGSPAQGFALPDIGHHPPGWNQIPPPAKPNPEQFIQEIQQQIQQINLMCLKQFLNLMKKTGTVNKSKRKRIRRKQNKEKQFSLKFVGNNADSLMNKLEALENIMLENPSAIFLQETHTKRQGRIKTPSSNKYTWYELHRTKTATKGENGGGIALAVMNVLEPSWISEGDDDAEAITVEIWVEGFPIRLVCGYGPQEYDTPERKDNFWKYLNDEVKNASIVGAAIVIPMDGNLWAGEKIIPNDPKPQNQNGKRLENFLLQNSQISVVNALPLCQGLITRVRHTHSGTQESVLDFFLVCDKILPLITSMSIDESGSRSLTKYKGGVVKSDHRILELKVDLMFHKERKHERDHVFNVRNKLCQKKFFHFTSEESMFTKCFKNSYEGIEIQFNRWQRLFTKALFACFRKVRITDDKNPKLSNIDALMNERKIIMKHKNLTEDDQARVEQIESKISEECSEKEIEKLKEALGELELGGGTNNTNVWKQMRKAFPKKVKSLPTGVKNEQGKVITNPAEKKKVTQNHFIHRMRKRSTVDEVKDIRDSNEKVFLDRLELARKNKCPPFTEDELDKVLKSLKNW